MNKSAYYNNLIKTVIDSSDATTWEDAVQEWEISDCDEDEEHESSCICGKENLRYLFTISNIHNHNTLFPIGSSCIKKFGCTNLTTIASLREQLFKLLHAIENESYILLSREYFSRELLRWLHEYDAFPPNCYNRNAPENDYQFLLDMFNKRNKNSITQAQNSKINAIIIHSIKPFLLNFLKNKIKRKNTNE